MQVPDEGQVRDNIARISDIALLAISLLAGGLGSALGKTLWQPCGTSSRV